MVIKVLQVFIVLNILALVGISQPLMVYGKHLISTKSSQEPTTIVYEPTKSLYDKANATNSELRGQLLTIDSDRYAIKVLIGSPPQEVLMEFDTGGGQPWISCTNLTTNMSYKHSAYFDHTTSSSYRNIMCNSPLCQDYESFQTCLQVDHPIPCKFSEEYADDSIPSGVMAQDTFTFINNDKHIKQVPNVLFGCVHKNTGGGVIFGNVGNLGLGLQRDSFFGEVAYEYSGKISYCLPDRILDVNGNSTGWVSFGGDSPQNMSYTPLKSLDSDWFYYVKVHKITVDNVVVDWSKDTNFKLSDTNMFLDTGSPYTYLPEPIYSRFRDSFIASMRKLAHIHPTKDYSSLLYTCYKFDKETQISTLKVPNVTFHFDQNVNLNLSVENIFDIYDRNEGIWCLAFTSTSQEGNGLWSGLLGSTFQQNFHIELAVRQKRVGFSRTNC